MVTYLTDHSDWLISALRLLIFFKIIAHHPIFRKTCVDTYAPTPLQKGGSLFGISSGRVSSFTVKKIRCFFSPLFWRGVGGDLLFIAHPNAHKKPPPVFTRAVHFSTDVAVKKVGRTPYLAFRPTTKNRLPFVQRKANPPALRAPPSKRGKTIKSLFFSIFRPLWRGKPKRSGGRGRAKRGGLLFAPQKKPPLRFHTKGRFSFYN